MSEALSSSEIEDVLSSIRRLVSDDMRPAPARAVDANKLLLTPSLRVVPAETHADLDAPPPAIDEVMAQLSAGVARQNDQWENEIGDTSLESPAQAEAAAQDWQDHQIDAYAEPFPDVLVQAPVETGDVLTEASAADADPWEQSGDEADTPATEPWTASTKEPDAAWADEAEQAVLQELNDPPQGAAPYQAQDADDIPLNEADEGEGPVDEAMLREIVRDVLREELQGRLGERITRNIRKLVRAEIARVMAAEE